MKSESPANMAGSFQKGPATWANHTECGASSQTRAMVPPKEIPTTKRKRGRENSSSVWGLVEMRGVIYNKVRPLGQIHNRLFNGRAGGRWTTGLWAFLNTLPACPTNQARNQTAPLSRWTSSATA